MAASGLIEPETLRSLIFSINFNDESDENSSVGYWERYNIVLNKKLLKRTPDGKFFYNISHDIGHEIGHSLIELRDLSEIALPNDLEKILSEIDMGTESEYIQECIQNGVSENILRKERIAELFGYYLSSGGDRDKFLLNRVMAFPNSKLNEIFGDEADRITIDTIKSSEAIRDAVSKMTKLFNVLDKAWPKIKESLQNVDLEEAAEREAPDFDTEYIPEFNGGMSGDYSSSAAQSMAPESLNTNITNKDTGGTHFGESGTLGHNGAKSEGLLSMFAHFIKDFSEEIPNVK